MKFFRWFNLIVPAFFLVLVLLVFLWENCWNILALVIMGGLSVCVIHAAQDLGFLKR